ncbi:MAG: hypothetical protein HY094_10060 [Candidatus Melainabacteria bacterium]|nr:hypothetical protein [Candidatus Melainabacteria bacterium]
MSAHTNNNQHSASIEHHKAGPWQILVESDLLNVLILALAMVYLGNKFFPQILDQRKKQISKELEEAKSARIKANEELEAIKQKTERVALEIEEIKQEAKKTGMTIKKQIEQDTEKELESLRLKVKREINSSQEEAIQDIKKSASSAAIKLAEEALSKIVKNQEVQKKLITEFLSELEKPSKN